jgi:hypothetical protein
MLKPILYFALLHRSVGRAFPTPQFFRNRQSVAGEGTGMRITRMHEVRQSISIGYGTTIDHEATTDCQDLLLHVVGDKGTKFVLFV